MTSTDWLALCRQALEAVQQQIPSPRNLLQQLLLSPSLSSRDQTPLRGASASCHNAQLSCHNSSVVVDTCCFNAPGGQLLQTQFWDASPSTGPIDSWTIHGLWPDHCDGTFDANCDRTRVYTNITSILSVAGAVDILTYMSTYWKDYQGNDENFWEHEWSKHGTCISTLDTKCYSNYVPQQEVVDFFNTTTKIFKDLPTYETLANANILPLTGKTYTATEIQAPLEAMHGASVILRCKNGALNEVWYHFDVRGSVQTGQFVPAEPNGATSNCPHTGIRYLPKSGTPAPTGSTTTTMTTTRNDIPSPTGTPFEGKGFLEVNCDGERTGCLISGGPWYTSGTCAGFRAQADIVEVDEEAHSFTLTSYKGPCGFTHGRFECSKSLTTQSIFSSTRDGQRGRRKLSYRNSTIFFAANAPGKYKKVFVHNEKDEDHSLELEILWSPAR